MKTLKKMATIRVISASIIIVLTLYFGGRKVWYYSSGPNHENRCGPFHDLTYETNLNITNTHDIYSDLNWIQRNGTINDASCLNETQVHGIIEIHNETEIQTALQYATENDLVVSMAGARHSMGGQAFSRNALVLDMTQFNELSVDQRTSTLTAQSGAKWHDIQNYIHPYGLAIKSMQSSDIFTVGGSISVNAHGMDHRFGSLASTIQSIRIMLADGSIKTLSRDHNRELFQSVIGGYGLFGVILDVKIDLTKDSVYAMDKRVVDYKKFPEFFETHILGNSSYELAYGLLSIAPSSFMKEIAVFGYRVVPDAEMNQPILSDEKNIALRRFLINVSKKNFLLKEVSWISQKHFESQINNDMMSHTNQEGNSFEVIKRNQIMHKSMEYLENKLYDQTDILQEYFVPKNNFVKFVGDMRDLIQEHNINVIYSEIRMVHEDEITLSYAREDMYSVVLFINQKISEKDNKKIKIFTRSLIEIALENKGTFYLPYQPHYSPEQILRAYPRLPVFLKNKKKYDPQLRFVNSFYTNNNTDLQ